MIRLGDMRIEQNHRDRITRIMDSTRLTEGPTVKEFESEVAKILNVPHAIAVTNGTVSLQLIGQYLRYKFGRNLRVCVPALTFPATINAFLILGMDVILCDVGYDLQIDLDSLTVEEKKLIDVMVPVHLMGYSADMERVNKEAKEYGWVVIEDAAEAFGATFKNNMVGSLGDFGSFSFYASHNIWAGELGLVTTKDKEANDIMRSMKNHGRTGDSMKFLHSYVGSNYKTTEFMAGMALENLKNYEKILFSRKENARYFYNNIFNDFLSPYPVTEDFSPLGYPIKATTKENKIKTTKLLNKNDIETRDMFPCLANQTAYKGMFDSTLYPVANELEDTAFYVGVNQYMTEKEKEKIVSIINSVK